jgi:DNA-binding MurR/RpiR family transcriptional regulator
MDKGIPLEGRAGSAFSSLSRSHQRVARFLLDDGLFAALASAADLGDKVGGSAATLVRFCQAIGDDGYPELQAAVAALGKASDVFVVAGGLSAGPAR